MVLLPSPSPSRFLSIEGLQYVVKQVLKLQVTPSIETHKYTILKKVKDYETREYPSYLVAETQQPPGSGDKEAG